MKESMDKIYRCFSGKQKNYLLDKGNEYVLRAKDYYNNNTFWLFIKTENLIKDLDLWRETNPNIKG